MATAGRHAALDGLRGVAAAVVVVFHFLCLIHPGMVPDMTARPARVADTPLGLLWNGPFAVAVFFVLSGFVLSGAAARRPAPLALNLVTRYLRLALPMLASLLLAWSLLTLMPGATAALKASLENPSPWLDYTRQEYIPPLRRAVSEGLVRAFLEGGSRLNNALWTMRIELLGSVGLFVLYWAAPGRARVPLLLAAVPAILAAAHLGWIEAASLGFALGALLQEAHVRGHLAALPAALPPVALVAGLLLGAPGAGWAERAGLSPLPPLWTIGTSQGAIATAAAALLLLAVLTLPRLARALEAPLPRWLGRISFGLYLVHVPLLYTVVAALALGGTLPSPVLFAIYAALALGLAEIFTRTVDAPVLAGLARLRVLVPALRADGARRAH